jgi:hypothetical protein
LFPESFENVIPECFLVSKQGMKQAEEIVRELFFDVFMKKLILLMLIFTIATINIYFHAVLSTCES